MEKYIQEDTTPISRLCIGLRVHVEDSKLLHKFYLDNFRRWLDYRMYTIINYTAGVHTNTANPHIHIHYIAEGKKLSNPIATMKRDFTEKLGTMYPNVPKAIRDEMPKGFTTEKYKGRINMSLQIKDLEENNIERFLQYPLKEGQLIDTDLDLVKVKTLTEIAQTEYKNSLAKQASKDRKEKEKESEWDKMVTELDKNNPTTIEQVFRELIVYYRTWNKPPTMKFIFDTAERYAFKKGIIDINYLLMKFNINNLGN